MKRVVSKLIMFCESRLVIMVLVDIANGKQRHVPYRDSKLSFLLQVWNLTFAWHPNSIILNRAYIGFWCMNQMSKDHNCNFLCEDQTVFIRLPSLIP